MPSQHHGLFFRVRPVLAAIALLLLPSAAFAVDYFSRVAGPVNWTANNTWSTVGCGGATAGGAEPGAAAGDTATICNGHTIVLNRTVTVANALTSLTVDAGGVLTFGDNTSRTLRVTGLTSNAGTLRFSGTGTHTLVATGGITNSGTFDVNTASNVTHVLNVGGDITNTGTFNLATDANSLANTTFNRNGNQTVSGAGAYTFNRITLNMGATKANILDMQSNFTEPANFLTITNGTYKHSNTSAITPWTADPNIPATGGFWLNGAATVTVGGFNVSLNGATLRISAGTMNIGTANNHFLRLLNSATTLLQMDGGALNVSGGITSASTTDAGTFTQSGGTITLATVLGGTAETFMLGSATTFNMSGGSLVLQTANNAADDLNIRSATQNVTGGTVQIGNASLTGTNNFLITNTTGAALNIWNLVLFTTGSPTTQIGTTLNVRNDVTIQSGATLLDNNLTTAFPINVGAGNATGNWTNDGTFSPLAGGTGTVTFTGTSATQTLGGASATTFNNLTINKSANDVTMGAATPSPTVNGTLTLTSGRMITAGASCAAATPVIVAAGGTIAGGSATSYVQGALRKNFNALATLNFRAAGQDEFPVGTASAYSPIEITSGTTATAGNVVVCATATDHPQIALSSIDAAKSVNRYWSMTNTGLTLSTLLDATFKFVAGDVDSGATTGNFIAERWDGATWNATTLVTAGATSTRVQNVSLTAGTNDFQIGEMVVAVPLPGDFNAFETSTAVGAVTGRIYTKLTGANFSLDVVAILAGVQLAAFTDTVLVDLVTGSSGGLNCPGAPAAITGTSQNVNLTGGRGTTGNFNVTSAFPDVRVRVRYPVVLPTVTSCSTDNFSIRPTALTVTSTDATQTNSSGTPAIKTGVNFNLTAASGVIGYTGTPLIDNTKVVGTPTAGSIGGSFAAAPAGTGTAVGNAFFYSEVGNFGLNANAVYDSSFTSVDQPGDCTADFSNALVGGKYGCSFGSVAVAQTTGSIGFGRFIPDNFAVSYNTPQFATTCGAGTFSYVGQTFSYATAPVITVTVRNGTSNGLTNATTANYAGAYMKLSNTAGTSLNQAPYATQGGRYSRFDALGGGTTPALDISQLPATTADPTIGAFAAGVGTLTFAAGSGFVFTRPTTTPNAPFSADIALALNIIDGDGVAYASNPAAFGAATSGNGMAFSAGKTFRFGRLRLVNTYGSELLDIRAPLRAEYYNGSGWSLNTADSCTAIPTSAFFISGGLSPVIQSGSPITLSGGLGTLIFNKTSTAGSFNLAADLNAAGVDKSCNTTHGGTAANLPWLQGFWAPAASCGGTAAWAQDPNARVKLGSSKAPYIYLRERY